MKKNVKIININYNHQFPSDIYAELIDIDAAPGRQIICIANLGYIFDTLRERPELNCINARYVGKGNFKIIEVKETSNKSLNKEQLKALNELEGFIIYNGVKCYMLEKLEILKKTLGIKS